MQYWGLTDPGCVRSQNQDTYMMEQLDRNSVLCVVCDGMGGAKSGNVASSLASEVFTQEIKRSYSSLMDREKCDQMLRSAAKLANFTVYDQALAPVDFSAAPTITCPTCRTVSMAVPPPGYMVKGSLSIRDSCSMRITHTGFLPGWVPKM